MTDSARGTDEIRAVPHTEVEHTPEEVVGEKELFVLTFGQPQTLSAQEESTTQSYASPIQQANLCTDKSLSQYAVTWLDTGSRFSSPI